MDRRRRHAATQYAFVYQPGGAPHDNVYDDWPTLVAAMSAISGPKLLQFDNSFLSILIPTGTWDMDDVTWVGREKGPSGFGGGGFGAKSTANVAI